MLSRALVWIPVALLMAAAMEPWAAMLHGRVWHGMLWSIHKSHHAPPRGRFERNDLLSTLHAPIAIALILYGCRAAPGVSREAAFGAGIGMSLFGVAYVVCHDGLVHGRLPVGWLARVAYFARLRDAHREHHRRGAAPYGLFAGPWVLARARAAEDELNAQKRPRARRAAPSGRASRRRGRAAPRGTRAGEPPPSGEGS